jgi:site-specific DNA-methyltransferase (adenine-specific)
LIELNRIYNEDCLEGMKKINDESIDMILCDLPYGTTACKWDIVIPFEPLWEQYERIIKDNGAIVLTASQPFTTKLIDSNIELFRYCWVWNKKISGNPLLAKHQPLKVHEDICVFSKKRHNYYPQMRKGKMRKKGGGRSKLFDMEMNAKYSDEYYPISIIEFSNAKRGVHPTQKPVALFEYLIKTYTNEGETVLDNCMGSGTTAIACLNTNRQYIGFENDKKYFDLANERINTYLKEKSA